MPLRWSIFPVLLLAMPAHATDTGVGGWIVPWQLEAGKASIERSSGALADVFLFAARLDPAGHPALDAHASDWPGMVAQARRAGARVWLTIVNDRVTAKGDVTLKDAEIVRELLDDPDRSRAHRAEIVALAKQLHVDGVDVDYENLPAALRDPFTAFARALSTELRAAGLASSFTVQPKTGDVDSRGPGAMDWPALCAAADRVQVMLYNEHNASTDPGPVAGIDFVGGVMDFAARSCPAAKLVPVLKTSGMDWGPKQASWVTFEEVGSRLHVTWAHPRRERTNRVPWFIYRGDDGRHIVYYEDAKSLAAKLDVLRARGFTRVVLWSLGSEDPDAPSRLAKELGRGSAQKR